MIRLRIWSTNVRTLKYSMRDLGRVRELEDFYAFDEIVSTGRNLVYFHAQWCGPCKFLHRDIGTAPAFNVLFGFWSFEN